MTETSSDGPSIPQDRPALSLPRAGAAALVGYYILWGLAPVMLFLNIQNVAAGGDPASAPVLLMVPIIAGPALMVVLGIRWGKIWALKLLRLLSWLGVAAVAAGTAISALVLAGFPGGEGQRDKVINAQFTFIELIFFVPLGWWLLRKIYTVRWLDPKSLPSEWEPPLNRFRKSRR